MKNKIGDLRNHLFATLEALQDTDQPMEIGRARAIADVAKVIVDSAKVEVEFARVSQQATASGFLPTSPERPRQLGAGGGGDA